MREARELLRGLNPAGTPGRTVLPPQRGRPSGLQRPRRRPRHRDANAGPSEEHSGPQVLGLQEKGLGPCSRPIRAHAGFPGPPLTEK